MKPKGEIAPQEQLGRTRAGPVDGVGKSSERADELFCGFYSVRATGGRFEDLRMQGLGGGEEERRCEKR